MSVYGIDLSSADELDFTREVEGVELVAQDVLWRLSTPAGQGVLAFDAPEYGLDLSGMLGASLTDEAAASMPGRIRSELMKDERLLSVDVNIRTTRGAGTLAWDITIRCTTASGPFDLVFVLDADGVAKASIKILAGSDS